MTAEASDSLLCPLCGGPNACGNLSAADNPADCWCHQPDRVFSQNLLDSVPAKYRGKACVCQQCVAKQALEPHTLNPSIQIT
ncbi:MAG TPA: hypothetical protein EYM37_06480 [Methylophaga aminisulfidivorans]|uniref:cysteine-rich CWC family protein n=1 Tax=Methylophaga TaxID=40222 RepID=UPI00176941C8|nr:MULTISPECIES: cysteine-rich CWC family protein [Methylophaga]HIC47038.1 hypothetical protein [Methylophaga sp.]HIM39572.1 hypothetical protein [Methylophaga aminisulfidivorans]